MSKVCTRAFVDRIEADSAVLLVGDERRQVLWPVNLLPEEAVEGTVVQLEINFDSDTTAEMRKNIKTRIERLKRGKQGS